jgi:hypothetical protein
VLSPLAVARVCPSGLKATALTVLVWPVTMGPDKLHSRAVVS